MPSISLQLGLDELTRTDLKEIDPADIDLIYLQRSFEQLDERCDAILAAYGVLSEIANSQQRLLETRATQNLQYLATVFLPLSLAAGVFSMNDAYMPAQRDFWVFVVVALIR